MRTFSVTSIYSIDNLSVSFYGSNSAIHVTFDIEYPDNIRNSKKVFKNLMKSSTELREIITEEVYQLLTTNEYTMRRNGSYASGHVLGKNCEFNIYLGSDFANQPINSFINELLRKMHTS